MVSHCMSSNMHWGARIITPVTPRLLNQPCIWLSTSIFDRRHHAGRKRQTVPSDCIFDVVVVWMRFTSWSIHSITSAVKLEMIHLATSPSCSSLVVSFTWSSYSCPTTDIALMWVTRLAQFLIKIVWLLLKNPAWEKYSFPTTARAWQFFCPSRLCIDGYSVGKAHFTLMTRKPITHPRAANNLDFPHIVVLAVMIVPLIQYSFLVLVVR